MLLNSSNNCHRFHPLLDSIACLIREYRSRLPDLELLECESEFINVKGEFNGEELFINNEMHSSRGLRRIHLESARLGAGLEILHCVFFPEPTFDLPIFGVDVVSGTTGISAAIVDLSPVSKDLPLWISNQLSDMKFPFFKKKRELPQWGKIFSKYALFIRPDDKDEEASFKHVVDQFLQVLVSSLVHLEPDCSDANATIERLNYQRFYCSQQRRNDKTRNVLSKAFDSQWADIYIEQFLFKHP